MGRPPGKAIAAAAKTAAKASAAKAAKKQKQAESDSSDEDELSGNASEKNLNSVRYLSTKDPIKCDERWK